MTKEKSFVPDDVVVTSEDEQDIDLIPAGTCMRLTRLCGVGLWWTHATLNGSPRTLLVYEDNLRHAF